MGGAEEDQLAATIENDGLVKHLEYPRCGLMNRHEDDFIVSHITDDFHDVLGVLRAESACRLVEKKDVGGADHIETDIESLAFTAAECFAPCVSDHEASALIEAEFGQLAVNATHPLAAAEVRSTNCSCKVEIFLNGEVLVKGIVLGDIRDVFSKRFVVFVERAVIKKDFALSWRKLPRERPQERAFPAPACAHHADHFTTFHREGNAIHRHGSVAETANQVANIERANHIFFLLDEALGKVAP